MLDIYHIHNPITNKDEKVVPEKFCWEAHYLDGSTLKQYNDEDASFHQLREINQPQLSVFRMINYDTGKFFDIQWHPARKLIHFYNRNVLDNGTQKVTLYCFGYETFFSGASHKVILVILPDDSLVVTEDIERIHIA